MPSLYDEVTAQLAAFPQEAQSVVYMLGEQVDVATHSIRLSLPLPHFLARPTLVC
jgi:hypothetical protein